MFSIKKQNLVKSLCRISCQLCGYLGTRCDCKYIDIDPDNFHRNSEQTGCCETAMAAILFNAMTSQEFYALAQRAGVHITQIDEEPVELHEFFEKMKKQRKNQLTNKTRDDNE